jgi:hypothetical protein
MNRYVTSIPRSVFAIAAVVMTAGTFGLSVIVPAQLASTSQAALAPAASKGVMTAPTEVAISPARIDVIGIREQKTAQEPGRHALPKHKQAG